MPTWVKVTLIVVVVVFIGVIAAVVLAARWVKVKGARFQEQARATVVEASEFGRGKNADACVAEALRRVRACDGFICEAKVRAFLQTCLRTADPSKQSCAGVPRPTEFVKAQQWYVEECGRRGMQSEPRCIPLMGALQVHCAE